MNKNILIIHKDWTENCCLENNKIYRIDHKDEYGYFIIENNKLTIKWEKWNEESFYCIDSSTYYLSEIYENNYENKIIFDRENYFLIILDKNKNFFTIWESKIIGEYILDDNILILKNKNTSKKYFKLNDNIFYIDDNIYFNITIEDNLIEENYIYNKLTYSFYNINNIKKCGVYKIVDNCLHMNWSNGYKKNFYTNKYSSYDNINHLNNIIIIKPNNIYVDDKILFSNISLCKNKIILTSIHYIKDPYNINDINIIVKNHNIIKKTILDNNDTYEPSMNIILELECINEENIPNNVNITIQYKKNKYEVYLEQLNIIEHNISAMTLFKDDYELLKRYIKYYEKLGVNIFYIYYNKKIDHNIIENIVKLNENHSKIYLTEWNYIYWWKYKDLINNSDENTKQHCAQTMAINDALNILKNYGNYILYNDLDEYFLLGEYDNFNNLIENNKDIDMFIFKNRFCKMGNEPIKYKDFDDKFNLSKIIEGNYWDMYREKNLIKLKNINVMGVHSCFKKFNNKNIDEKIVGQFYHIINFEEKNREILMKEYIR
jgi:hypothetical protein